MRRLFAVCNFAAARARAHLSGTTIEYLEHPATSLLASRSATGGRSLRSPSASDVMEHERDNHVRGGGWIARGLRAIGLAVDGRPAAVEGLLFVSGGGGSLECCPVGLEVGVAAAGNNA